MEAVQLGLVEGFASLVDNVESPTSRKTLLIRLQGVDKSRVAKRLCEKARRS